MSNELSPAGEARKRRMLRELNGVMARRTAGRRARRLAVAAVVVAAPALAWMSLWGGPRMSPTPNTPIATIPAPSSVVMVTTDDGVLNRLTIRGDQLSVQMISDRELGTLLEETGNSTGFVRLGGRVILADDLEPETGDDSSL